MYAPPPPPSFRPPPDPSFRRKPESMLPRHGTSPRPHPLTSYLSHMFLDEYKPGGNRLSDRMDGSAHSNARQGGPISNSNILEPLVSVIETVKRRIAEHGASLRENETRTRTALIDPLLQALGWDVSDPSVVTTEFDVEGRRADYALLRSGDKPAATIEAKRLGEPLHTHRMQMLNYANAKNVDYAGLTDGNVWELYDVFKRGELHERELLSVTIADSPSHESALKLLRLWRPNIISGAPMEARTPIVGLPDDNAPTAQAPTAGSVDGPPSPDSSAEWTPLGGIQPTKDNRPSRLKLPDNSEQQVRWWKDVSVKLVEWLYAKGHLTPDMLPLKTSGGATMVDRIKMTNTSEQAGTQPIYVEKPGSGATHAHRWRFIARESHTDLNSIFVQIR